MITRYTWYFVSGKIKLMENIQKHTSAGFKP